MERMSLREAAVRSARSVTTLRRHIRSGRLQADKLPGRFGPEYFVTPEQLDAAGLDAAPVGPGEAAHASASEPTALVRRDALDPSLSTSLERLIRDTVPVTLFQELQMKHEQLLVQYGMVRAGGLRVLEMQAELDSRRKSLEDAQAENARVKERLAREAGELRKKLREAELELEGRRIEASALREKVRALEMLTRNRITNETIDRQFSEVAEQMKRVERMSAEQELAEPDRGSVWPLLRPHPDPEH
jgi:septal ring factor EnvC (AmiA/AmiB activator)